jgi:hypothetical protein
VFKDVVFFVHISQLYSKCSVVFVKVGAEKVCECVFEYFLANY